MHKKKQNKNEMIREAAKKRKEDVKSGKIDLSRTMEDQFKYMYSIGDTMTSQFDKSEPSNFSEGSLIEETFINVENIENTPKTEDQVTSPVSHSHYSYLITSNDNTEEPSGARYSFLTNPKDKNGVNQGDDGYDPTTLYVPEDAMKTFTPFERQFWEIKRGLFDTVLFFKKGNFYELYENDADLGRKLFDLRVVERAYMRMAGVPIHTYDVWAHKFLNAGYKVARVDERENSLAKKMREKKTSAKKEKVLQRFLTEVVTPATVYNCDHMNSPLPFYIAVLLSNALCHSPETCSGDYHYSVLLYDASVNTLYSKSVCDNFNMDKIRTIFAQNEIREILTNCVNLKWIQSKITQVSRSEANYDHKFKFDHMAEQDCFEVLFEYFKILKREGVFESATLNTITKESNVMQLDAATIQNMDLLVNNFDKTAKYSLIEKINHCSTPFGSRKLHRWILSPLTNQKLIEERRRHSDAMGCYDTTVLVMKLRELGDLERLGCRLKQKKVTLDNLRQFINKLTKTVELLRFIGEKDTLGIFKPDYFIKNLTDKLDAFTLSYKVTDDAIEPVNESDELFTHVAERVEIENQLENERKKFEEEFKIPTKFVHKMKDIFQIEVEMDAFEWIPTKHKSELEIFSKTKNAIRFFTKSTTKLVQKYKEIDELIFQSSNTVLSRAVSLFNTDFLLINELIDYLATFDCSLSFHLFNRANPSFSRPVFIENGPIQIESMTSPIYTEFIENDFKPIHPVVLLTGPNMGGKSTFLRSVCLNIILAQMGLNVACSLLRLPVFDQIFTRIGASDSLAKNESTFMVEMNECSKVLQNATERSFVIMDELGRGTSTRDGTAIARAVLEHLKRKQCTVLFSTHYHSLVKLVESVHKYSVQYTIENDQIIFLYKIEEGVSEESHGIYVAKLAGVPDVILERAKSIRKDLIN
ncbi:DNA mismatch repair protein Msh6 [Enterospora canceri]|uniref:DNA mismatch repair protein Msh6 n=1 Tax=Enterospora canceri TaxID=1081671 RepID=A0A1Y1SAL8_9MICR|nr:DNA mismatch repair protein Msh6 [Enterospora canceri]